MNQSIREVERKVLRLLHNNKTWNHLRQIHAHIHRHGLNQCNQVLPHFVSVCGSLNKMEYSDRVFDQTHNPNIFLSKSMIKGCSVCGPFEESLRLFSWMKRECGIWADEYTFAPLLKACSSLGDLRFRQCAQKEVVARGFDGFSSIRIGVVELYTTCGAMEDARKVFDEMWVWRCFQREPMSGYAFPPSKAQAVVQETLLVWWLLASRLGLSSVQPELEDLCFRVCHVCC